MTAFEKWMDKYEASGALDHEALTIREQEAALDAWVTCAAEAERLCRESQREQERCRLGACLVAQTLGDAIAKLREVDR